MGEYIPFNVHFETLSTTCQRLFQIFYEFDDINVSYGNLLRRLYKGRLGMTVGGKPLSWTKNNIRLSINLDGPAFFVGSYVASLSGWALPSNMGEHIRPGVFIADTNLADRIQMNLATLSLCCLYNGLRDIVKEGLQEGQIKEKLVHFPLQYLCSWLRLHFPSIYLRGETNPRNITYINTLKN